MGAIDPQGILRVIFFLLFLTRFVFCVVRRARRVCVAILEGTGSITVNDARVDNIYRVSIRHVRKVQRRIVTYATIES